MSQIELSKDAKTLLVDKLQTYFTEELDYDLGQFPAEFLVEFLAKEIGPTFYNQGLYDAVASLKTKQELLNEELLSLEKF